MSNREPPIIPTYRKSNPLPIILLCIGALLALLIVAGLVAFFFVVRVAPAPNIQTNSPPPTPIHAG